MRTFPALIICEHCDSVYHRCALGAHEEARCDRCHACLFRGSSPKVDSWLALTIAAAIMFLIANVFPVVRISLQGLHNEATLWQAAASMEHGPWAPIAVPTAVSAILAPLLQIVLLSWVLGYAQLGRRAPGFVPAMRMLVALRPWGMVEVALLGILVAIVKLSGLMEVTPRPGIWATAALAVLLTLITRRPLHGLWDLPAPDGAVRP